MAVTPLAVAAAAAALGRLSADATAATPVARLATGRPMIAAVRGGERCGLCSCCRGWLCHACGWRGGGPAAAAATARMAAAATARTPRIVAAARAARAMVAAAADTALLAAASAVLVVVVLVVVVHTLALALLRGERPIRSATHFGALKEAEEFDGVVVFGAWHGVPRG